METRMIEQARVFVLVLNPFSRVEDGCIAAVSTDYTKLVEFYLSQLLPNEKRYHDDAGFYISFKEGPLKHLNPCESLELNDLGLFGHGIHDEWVPLEQLSSVMQRYFEVK